MRRRVNVSIVHNTFIELCVRSKSSKSCSVADVAGNARPTECSLQAFSNRLSTRRTDNRFNFCHGKARKAGYQRHIYACATSLVLCSTAVRIGQLPVSRISRLSGARHDAGRLRLSRVSAEPGQFLADEPVRTAELRSRREVQDTHNEARIKRCRLFWGIFVSLQARLCKSRGARLQNVKVAIRGTQAVAHM